MKLKRTSKLLALLPGAVLAAEGRQDKGTAPVS